jgi:hypothetical protein
MKRLLMLLVAAFVFAFTAPIAAHNAFAADDAATSATDDAMKGSPTSENTKTNGMKHTHAHKHHAAGGHKHRHAAKHHHHKKAAADKGGDAPAGDAGK